MIPGVLSMGADNVLAHVPAPVLNAGLVSLDNLKVPALALLTESEASSLRGRASNIHAILHAILNNRPPARIVEIRPN